VFFLYIRVLRKGFEPEKADGEKKSVRWTVFRRLRSRKATGVDVKPLAKRTQNPTLSAILKTPEAVSFRGFCYAAAKGFEPEKADGEKKSVR